ncbi:MAG: hypothetical protein JXR19_05245 [Bacteroidia bacterium]
MGKVSHKKRVIGANFSLALFDSTGQSSEASSGALVLSRMMTSCGKTAWDVIHLN